MPSRCAEPLCRTVQTGAVLPSTVRVFTDGACAGNPGPGGWGWAVDLGPGGTGPSCSGSERASTNQRMEVWAVLDALTTFLECAETDPHLTVVSDSTYVVNCFRDSWYRGWISRGWKNTQKQPVANQDLWKPLVSLYLAHPGSVTFEWVKGHSGNRMNDLVDAIAVRAGASQYVRTLVDPLGWFSPVAPEPDPIDTDQSAPAAEQVSLF